MTDNLYTTSIASGIGDILLNKLINPNCLIYYNYHHLTTIKSFPDNVKNIVFNYTLLNKLFKEVILYYKDKNYTITHIDFNLLSKVVNYDLSSYFNIIPVYNFEYIVIHTKLRFGYESPEFVSNIKDVLKTFFSTYKSPLPIIILGDRKLAKNTETVAHPTMKTIYDEILLLKNNNEVIDMTVDVIYNTPEIKQFEHDISIIYNAKMNIGIGIGGQFCFNLCFSKNTLYYCPPSLINFKINKQNFNVHTTIELFTENFPR